MATLSVPCIFNKDANGIAINQVAIGQEWAVAGNVLATRKPDGIVCSINLGKVFRADGTQARWYRAVDLNYADAIENLKRERTRILDRHYILCNAQEAGGQAGVKVNTLYPYVALAGQVPDLTIHNGWTDIPFLTKQAFLTFNILKAACELRGISGVVLHHPDGRAAEVTRADFGLPLVLPGEIPTPEQISIS